ncbi:MAG: hypothetical protein ABI718_10475 [Acidobacteriota bacterium]
MTPSSKIFLLSPANPSGLRARQMMSSRATFDVATRFRAGTVPIEDAFAFMSALYFRGKIAYARRFASPPPDSSHRGIFVIAPGFGLVPAGWTLDEERMKKLSRTAVDLRSRNYYRPLRSSCMELAATLAADAQVILLGSIATGKYVDVVWPVFGDRLRFPRNFVGIGDMSRGSLMLNASRSGEELEYAPLDIPRHRPRTV